MDIASIFNLKPKRMMGGISSVLATICPGALILFVYARDLFVSLEASKILVLSLAITLPVVLLNLITALPTALLHGTPSQNASEIFEFEDWLFQSCIYTAICFYVGLGMSVLAGWPLKSFVVAVVGCIALLNLWTWNSFLSAVRSGGKHPA